MGVVVDAAIAPDIAPQKPDSKNDKDFLFADSRRFIFKYSQSGNCINEKGISLIIVGK